MTGIGLKIVLSGVVLSLVWLIPSLMRECKPPLWFKAIVVITGLVGLLMTFFGTLWAIWE